MSESRQCICCGGGNVSPVLRGLLRCNACGHVWADLRLSGEDLRALYSERYFKGEEYVDYELERPALQRNFRARAVELWKLMPSGGVLWEIGCAYGFFLEEAAAYFTVGGCDISAEAVQAAQRQFGNSVKHGDYLELDPGPCDAICLWDTVEHLQQPDLYIEKASRDLRRNGLLALSTGDIGSLCARFRGEHWRLIHPPTHLHYFTRNSISVLLQRLGLQVIRVSYPPFWRSTEAIAQKLLQPGRSVAGSAAYGIMKATGVTKLTFPLNLFDLMTVIARKP